MSKKVFVSYSHSDGDWVWRRLKPALEGGGAEVLIDRERFVAGKAVFDQMDDTQDQADVHALVITETYLNSAACLHEMNRAIALDPDFDHGIVVPVRRDDHKPWPAEISNPNPIFVDLRDDGQCDQWDLLMQSAGADLKVAACDWLDCVADTNRFLNRGDSVNLVADRGSHWEQLLSHLQSAELPEPLLPVLKRVDLEDTATYTRPALLGRILTELGHRTTIPPKGNDLVEFGRVMERLPKATVALTRFDLATTAERQAEYGEDLFTAIRNLVSTKKKLVLLIVSHSPFATHLPIDSPLSQIDMKTTQLRSRP